MQVRDALADDGIVAQWGDRLGGMGYLEACQGGQVQMIVVVVGDEYIIDGR